jgi:hypothetical protein
MILEIYNKNTGINPVFVRANTELLRSFKEQLNQLMSVEDRKTALEELWLAQYNAKLVKSTDSVYWSNIEFLDQKSAMLFLLKWY